ncbi:MAG: hypothetical protein EOM20_20670 [Spartobacteria bacterium]|nr:hypothetical protein [Spartobacteria bacterium]
MTPKRTTLATWRAVCRRPWAGRGRGCCAGLPGCRSERWGRFPAGPPRWAQRSNRHDRAQRSAGWKVCRLEGQDQADRARDGSAQERRGRGREGALVCVDVARAWRALVCVVL